MRSVHWLWLAIALGGCGPSEAPAEAPAPSPRPVRPVAAPRAVATAAAFDLVRGPTGALLYWGPRSEEGGGLRVARVGPEGEAVGRESVIVQGRADDLEAIAPFAVEVAAATGGGRTGVAWLERRRMGTVVVATHGADAAEVFAPPEQLAATDAPARVTRGATALAASSDGTLTVLHRAGDGACGDDPRATCRTLRVRRLGGNEGADLRQGLPLAVPAVCDRAAPGYVFADGTFYYALCALEGDAPVTTVYSIRFDPQYAQADRVLAGCEPLGLSRVGEGAAAVLARCGEGRVDAVVLREVGQRRVELASVVRTARCEETRPVLVLSSGAETVEVPLTAPEDRLEALLPDALEAERGRAVWTGRALLLAVPLGREVELRRYECLRGQLRRTDLLEGGS